MKMRLLPTLAGLAIGFAVPTLAQEQTTVDPQVRQQFEAIEMKFVEAFNNRDLATIAALHTQDAKELRSWQGWAIGQEAIVKRFESDFAGNPGKMVNKIVHLYPIGDAICKIVESNVGGWKNHVVSIYVRDGDTWKNNITYVSNK